MNHPELTTAALRVLRLLEDYTRGPHREMLIDPALYAYCDGRFGNMSRQHQVRVYGSSKPKRIDYRAGGPNPTVIEFAVRPKKGGPQLYGSQNQSELRKLTRVPQTRAKRRVLLLLDLFKTPCGKTTLQATYDAISSGPGNFKRHSVRVIYVHSKAQFSFLWKA